MISNFIKLLNKRTMKSKFIQKSVEVTAIQVNSDEVNKFTGDQAKVYKPFPDYSDFIFESGETVKKVTETDYIVKFPDGRLETMSEKEFNERFKEVFEYEELFWE